MKVMMLGLRGFPDVQGGVEKHVEYLSQELERLGCDVEVIVRSRYVKHLDKDIWEGVRIIRLWSPKSQYLEAIVHSLLGVLVARWHRADILHIHAIGPALVTPFARILGLRVVVTHHGPDYERQKWNPIAKLILRVGEMLGMLCANERIVISNEIHNLIYKKYSVASEVIPNGVWPPPTKIDGSVLAELGLTPQRYILTVGRLVPEKRQIDLLDAFLMARIPGWRLAIVGSADYVSSYQKEITDRVRHATDVVATGSQTGTALLQLYSDAGMFVLPSSHEGLPIALLEALSHGLPVIASDIPANLEIGLDELHYFPVGDVAALAHRLQIFATKKWPDDFAKITKERTLAKFDWVSVAQQTLRCYQSCKGIFLFNEKRRVRTAPRLPM